MMDVEQHGSDTFIYVGSMIHSISLKQLEYIENGIIVICKKSIAYIQKNTSDLKSIQEQFKVHEKNVHILEKGQFLIPGFVDTHIHAPQYPNLGLGYDVPLLQWLEKYTFPLESKFKDEKYAQRVYDAVVRQTLASGTTTATYFATIHKKSSCILAEAALRLGQRAFIGKVNMTQNAPSELLETFEESLKDTKDFIEYTLSLDSPLVKPIITPRFAPSCNIKLLIELSKLADLYDIPIQTHISENLDEIKFVKELFPDYENYLDIYNKAGLITEKTILAHGIHLNPEELKVIKQKGATVSHCASSNVLLQSGICPVSNYLYLGVKVALGTDCSGGSSCSMLESIRQALILSISASFHKISEKLTHEEVFYMATLGGAEGLCLQNKIGNFLNGKDFDAVLVDLNDSPVVDLLEDYTLKQLFEKFLYLGDDRALKKVYVAGRLVNCKNNENV